jgi:hypothetical protein
MSEMRRRSVWVLVAPLPCHLGEVLCVFSLASTLSYLCDVYLSSLSTRELRRSVWILVAPLPELHLSDRDWTLDQPESFDVSYNQFQKTTLRIDGTMDKSDDVAYLKQSTVWTHPLSTHLALDVNISTRSLP